MRELASSWWLELASSWPCLFCSLDQFFPRKPPRKGFGSGPGSHLGPGPIWAWVPFGPRSDIKTMKKTINKTFPWSPPLLKSLYRHKINKIHNFQMSISTVSTRPKSKILIKSKYPQQIKNPKSPRVHVDIALEEWPPYTQSAKFPEFRKIH